MSGKKCGKRSVFFDDSPRIISWASIAGKKEAEGPLGSGYDITNPNPYWGQGSWEKAEKKMQQLTLLTLLKKANLFQSDLDVVFSGDLLNQCITSSFTLRNSGIPHLGLYGACSTMAEGLLLASLTVGANYFKNTVAMSSSHFASSERQYRFPLGYGGQRTPTAQWTVTGAGACLVSSIGSGPRITGCTIGTITDLGVKDANNMGAAMAPAALDTIRTHMQDFCRTPNDYDFIVTGDLGKIGRELLIKLARKEGIDLENKLIDCGMLVYDTQNQDVHAGGSGCGCSAIALCSYLLNNLQKKKWNRILFCGTGALLSPTSAQQGLPIPGICHGIVIEGA